MQIREENDQDYKKVFKLIESAFASEEQSDHQEQFLVERLRQSEAFVPQLSLVAEINKEIVGYILLTEIKIKGESSEFTALALAPVAVAPAHQGKGIGGSLIRSAHATAKTLGYKAIVVLGHADYYPKFGYLPTVDFGIRLPFDVPAENAMVIELVDQALQGHSGTVVYAKEFMD